MNKNDFETAINRLNEVVENLESDTVSLENSMALFEEGMQLIQECKDLLQESEERVKTLLKENDEFKEVPGVWTSYGKSKQ